MYFNAQIDLFKDGILYKSPSHLIFVFVPFYSCKILDKMFNVFVVADIVKLDGDVKVCILGKKCFKSCCSN